MAQSNTALTGDLSAGRLALANNLATSVAGSALDATQGTALKAAADTLATVVGGKVAATSIGAANGIAPLDGTGKVPSSALPSYVDDVLEFANLAALPAIGETGKIYVALDTNFEYRWGGSAYVRLVSSPGSSDAVPEGSTNLYFTAARALAAVSGGAAPVTFTTQLPFTGSADMGSTQITGALAFTANTTGAVTNGGGVATLIADGAHAPTFGGGLKPVSAAAGVFVNVAGVANDLAWNKTPSGYVYALSQPGYAVSTAPPLTIASAAVANSAPGAVAFTFIRNLDTGFVPPLSAFAIEGHPVSTSQGAVATISGATISVPMATPFANGETVRHGIYTAPSSGGLRDQDGVLAPTSASVTITNNVQAAVGTLSGTTINFSQQIDLTNPVQKDWKIEAKRNGTFSRAGTLGSLFTDVVSGAALDQAYNGSQQGPGSLFVWSDGKVDGGQAAVRTSPDPQFEFNGTQRRFAWDGSANPIKVGFSVNLVDKLQHKVRFGLSASWDEPDQSNQRGTGTFIVTLSDNPQPLYIPFNAANFYDAISGGVEITVQAATTNATLTIVYAGKGTYTSADGIVHQLGNANAVFPYLYSLA